MGRQKPSGEREERSASGLVGPFISPSGAMMLIPRALDSGPPRPEPEERWTLGPRPPEATTADVPDPSVKVEPVVGTVVLHKDEDPRALGDAGR